MLAYHIDQGISSDQPEEGKLSVTCKRKTNLSKFHGHACQKDYAADSGHATDAGAAAELRQAVHVKLPAEPGLACYVLKSFWNAI